MKIFIIALVAALVFAPVSAMACGCTFEKGDPSAARGSIYDMTSHSEYCPI